MTVPDFTLSIAIQLYSSEADFVVNFDDAYQWLGYSDKEEAKASFLALGFFERKDYRLGFNREREYELTLNCFTTWCVASGRSEGKFIRYQCLECEQLTKKRLAQEVRQTARLVESLRYDLDQFKWDIEYKQGKRDQEQEYRDYLSKGMFGDIGRIVEDLLPALDQIKELQNEVEELYNEVKEPVAKSLDNLINRVKKLETEQKKANQQWEEAEVKQALLIAEFKEEIYPLSVTE